MARGDQEKLSFKNPCDLRVLLSRIESDMYLWAKGYEEITQRKLDQLLHIFEKAVDLADDSDKEMFQNMLRQLGGVQTSLLRSEPGDHLIAQKIVSAVHELRCASISVLRPVGVEDVMGAHVIYFNHGLSKIGQVVRFGPASREKKAFGFIGQVIIQLADEQKAMWDLFQEIYYFKSDSPFLFDLYLWPGDLPALTFLEPGRLKDLLTIEWTSPLQEDDEDQEDEEEAASIPEENTIVKTIRAGDGDRRIGMRVFSMIEKTHGHLDSIEVYANGAERWIATSSDGMQMIDESSLFWLEINEYQHLYPTRVLGLDDISHRLLEELRLREEKAELADHDEIIHFQRRLDSLLKFLNGDIEDDKQQKRIAAAYQTMLWGSASLDEAQREEAVRQTAAKIDQLRRSRS